jgi:hypothetical protein
MRCFHCGSAKVNRSQRQGVKEGLLLRLVFKAPYRCRDCGKRFYAFHRHHSIKKGKNQSLAEFIGLRGRDHKVRHVLVTLMVTLMLLGVAIVVVLRIIRE